MVYMCGIISIIISIGMRYIYLPTQCVGWQSGTEQLSPYVVLGSLTGLEVMCFTLMQWWAHATTYDSFCMLELIFPCLLSDVSSPHPFLSWWTNRQNEECTNSSTYMCRIETAQILDLTGSYLSTSVGQQLWYRAKLLSIFSLWHALLVISWFDITMSCKQARTMHMRTMP